MKIQGQDITSTATQKSARALMVSAMFVILAKIYSIPLETLTVLEVNVPLAAIKGSIMLIIGFQMINHAVHWCGDLFNAAVWNMGQPSSGVTRIGRTTTQTQLESALFDLSRVTGPKGIQGAQITETKQPFQSELSNIHDQLSSLNAKVSALNRYARFYFFGWYMTLPMLAGFVALGLPSTGFEAP